jgi:hypothetical protein
LRKAGQGGGLVAGKMGEEGQFGGAGKSTNFFVKWSETGQRHCYMSIWLKNVENGQKL